MEEYQIPQKLAPKLVNQDLIHQKTSLVRLLSHLLPQKIDQPRGIDFLQSLQVPKILIVYKMKKQKENSQH